MTDVHFHVSDSLIYINCIQTHGVNLRCVLVENIMSTVHIPLSLCIVY